MRVPSCAPDCSTVACAIHSARRRLQDASSNDLVVGRPPTFLDFPPQVLSYQLFLGVAFCHSKEVLHLDLKPDNLLIKQARSPL